MQNPKVDERAVYFGSGGGVMKGTIIKVEPVDDRVWVTMKLDQYDGQVRAMKECFRRLKKKNRTIWLNADHVDNMLASNEGRTVNASPHETRQGQRWRAYRPVKSE